jgi:hypothetical protein
MYRQDLEDQGCLFVQYYPLNRYLLMYQVHLVDLCYLFVLCYRFAPCYLFALCHLMCRWLQYLLLDLAFLELLLDLLHLFVLLNQLNLYLMLRQESLEFLSDLFVL